MDDSEFLRLGRVVRSHGLRGQVVVEPAPGMVPVPEGVRTVHARGSVECVLTLDRAQPVGKSLVFRFEELARREESDPLRGCELWIPRSEVQLPEGEVFTAELVGSRVVLADGLELGVLQEVWSTGANDVYVVRGERGEWLLPATAEVVLDVDVVAHRVTVRLLPGMEPEPPKAPAKPKPAAFGRRGRRLPPAQEGPGPGSES